MVIFGVTGDLSRKKLMPAFYDLANRGLLPPGFALVGFARRDWADENFAELVHDAVREHARTPFREEVWARLSERIRFVPGSFDDDAAFDGLASVIDDLDKERGTGGNHAFYLSIPPAMFPVVLKQLARTGLAAQDGDRWRRVLAHDLRQRPRRPCRLRRRRGVAQVDEPVEHRCGLGRWSHQLEAIGRPLGKRDAHTMPATITPRMTEKAIAQPLTRMSPVV